jgi:hypothetical protein
MPQRLTDESLKCGWLIPSTPYFWQVLSSQRPTLGMGDRYANRRGSPDFFSSLLSVCSPGKGAEAGAGLSDRRWLMSPRRYQPLRGVFSS